MKRKIYLCVLLALTVLLALCFSSCGGDGIYVDTGSGTDGCYDSDTNDTNGNPSTDTDGGTGDMTDTDAEGGSDNEEGSQDGTGNENEGQGGTDSGDGSQDGNDSEDGNDNQGDGEGGNADNDNGDNGGDEEAEKPVEPITYTDKDGFVYVEENGELYCVDFVRPVDSTQVVYMPSKYLGKDVVGIRANAFNDFGVAFNDSTYKNASYYYTIAIPPSIRVIEASAFDKCLGMRIALYSETKNGEAVKYRLLDFSISGDLTLILDWESKLTLFDKSDKYSGQVRDTIWGFRPALGWSRYSAVVIPDYYE